MSKPMQRRAERVPMRPKPTISTVLPDSSIGSPPWRSPHRPPRTSRSIAAFFFASAIIRWNACSATEVELAVPAIISGTPRAVRAGTSTAS